MSNEYPLNDEVSLGEQSCMFDFMIAHPDPGLDEPPVAVTVKKISPQELRLMIIRQIEALSYFSDDPEEVLRRFNVNYGDKQ